MVVRKNWGPQTQTITPWTFESSDEAELTGYSIKYALEDQDGGAAPDWINIDLMTILARDSDSADKGNYALRIKGTVYDAAGLPVEGAVSYENLHVKVVANG